MILPRPGESFEWRGTSRGPALVCTALEELAHHLFTTRHWPLGQSRDQAVTGWGDVAAAMGVDAAVVVRLQQVHGAAVVVADGATRPAGEGERPAGDILISNGTAVIAVQGADCVPLLLADRCSGAVAAAHAGWRGMAARVPQVSVEALQREYGARPEDLVAAIGPSIAACCYEVGADVRERFADAGTPSTQLERWLLPRPAATAVNHSMRGLPSEPRPGYWYLDGWTVVRDQLIAAGLDPTRIFSADLCTASHPGVLCSYRRDGADAGRMAGAIAGARAGSSRRPRWPAIPAQADPVDGAASSYDGGAVVPEDGGRK